MSGCTRSRAQRSFSLILRQGAALAQLTCSPLLLPFQIFAMFFAFCLYYNFD